MVIQLGDQILVTIHDAHPAVVVIHIAVVIHQRHVEGGHFGKPIDFTAVFFMEIIEDLQAFQSIVDHLIHGKQPLFAFEQTVPLLGTDVFVDPSGN